MVAHRRRCLQIVSHKQRRHQPGSHEAVGDFAIERASHICLHFNQRLSIAIDIAEVPELKVQPVEDLRLRAAGGLEPRKEWTRSVLRPIVRHAARFNPRQPGIGWALRAGLTTVVLVCLDMRNKLGQSGVIGKEEIHPTAFFPNHPKTSTTPIRLLHGALCFDAKHPSWDDTRRRRVSASLLNDFSCLFSNYTTVLCGDANWRPRTGSRTADIGSTAHLRQREVGIPFGWQETQAQRPISSWARFSLCAPSTTSDRFC